MIVTTHALQRFRVRVDPNADESDVLLALRQSRLLPASEAETVWQVRAQGHIAYYHHAALDCLIVVDETRKRIVTILKKADRP